MKRILTIVVVVVLAGAGIWYAFGNGEKASNSYGQAVGTAVTAIGDIQANPAQFLGKEVTVEGEMTKECPSSGCWWYIKDASGEIRADSFGSGFALPLNKEGTRVRTTGKVTRTDGGELQIGATGAALK